MITVIQNKDTMKVRVHIPVAAAIFYGNQRNKTPRGERNYPTDKHRPSLNKNKVVHYHK